MKAQSGKVQITAVPSPEVREPGTRARRARAETHSVRVAHQTTIEGSSARMGLTVEEAGSFTHRETTAEVSQNFTSLPLFHAKRF